ncbi:hypothetical protein [Ghiorsea bivora]|uniref:hypothetical protein n=1 Tax=Ghiorsea bivora TaxID=1485545 RepID=UPI0012FD5C34|nr:hypothetical protein [Ghiorsea bivora]
MLKRVWLICREILAQDDAALRASLLNNAEAVAGATGMSDRWITTTAQLGLDQWA